MWGDGSEDLVSLDLSTADYTLIKHLVPKEEGRWAFVRADLNTNIIFFYAHDLRNLPVAQIPC